ncbi:MAG: hypothetical protein DRJ01_06670 [Bacteroidetes bacterium]|nr:MAG: hypothetical protein DRJ01_06670 [Bacteroidota bacterium]
MPKINSKKKGNRGELDCVKLLNEALGEGFARVPSSGAWGGGQNKEKRKDMSYEQKITLVADIMAPPKFNFVLEHKFYAEASFWDLFNDSSNLNEWIKQVEEDAEFVGKEPMLIVKYNRHKRIVLTKKLFKDYVFEWKGWYCGNFKELLKNNRYFWFVE